MPTSRIFCLAKYCYNYQPSPGSPAFFNLPADAESRRKWIDNAGRSDLKEKTVTNLSGKHYICADHFEPHCFIDPIKRTMLRRDPEVVPTIFKCNLSSLVSIDTDKTFRDSQSTLAGTVLAEVESAQEILNAAVVTDDVLDSAEWTNIVAVSLGDDGSLMCDAFSSPSQGLPESSIDLVTEEAPDSDATVMECLMLCRLCAALVQINMLAPIFGGNSDSNVKQMIERIIPGQVLLDDGLPQRVCANCIERVQTCCEILDLFKAADSRLRQMVQLCNIDDRNIEEGGTLTLQSGNNLPVILQTVGEPSANPMESNGSFIVPDFHKGVASLHGNINNTNQLDSEQMKLQSSATNIASTDYVAMACPMNVKVYPSQDVVNVEEVREIRCSLCQQMFSDQSELLSHCINYHSIKLDNSVSTPGDLAGLFQCTICNDVFSTSNFLKNHMVSHVFETYNCSLCEKSFNDKIQLHDHIIEDHQDCLEQKESIGTDGKHKCELCGKEFKNAIALRKHKPTHTGERTVLCSLCGKTLANLNSLRVHMRIHSEDRPFSCAECGKCFKGTSELRSHSVTHSREKIYNCPECGRKFHSKGLVRQHMISHTREKLHKCNMCTASFNRLGNLNQHKKKHGDKSVLPAVTPYECNTCGKRFQSKLTLKYHLSKHTGDKYPFDCEICGKKFIAIDPYRVHMRSHTGERPFECEVCKKTFRSSATLKQHTASLHRDDFPYACPFCQRSFKRLQSLIVHKKTHTGEKPWLCSQCGRAFAQKGDMLKHTKTHKAHVEEEAIIMEVDTIDDLALDTEISKMIFG